MVPRNSQLCVVEPLGELDAAGPLPVKSAHKPSRGGTNTLIHRLVWGGFWVDFDLILQQNPLVPTLCGSIKNAKKVQSIQTNS